MQSNCIDRDQRVTTTLNCLVADVLVVLTTDQSKRSKNEKRLMLQLDYAFWALPKNLMLHRQQMHAIASPYILY